MLLLAGALAFLMADFSADSAQNTGTRASGKTARDARMPTAGHQSRRPTRHSNTDTGTPNGHSASTGTDDGDSTATGRALGQPNEPGSRAGLSDTEGVRTITGFRGLRIPGFGTIDRRFTRTTGQSAAARAGDFSDFDATTDDAAKNDGDEEEKAVGARVIGQVTARVGDGQTQPVAGLVVALVANEAIDVEAADATERMDAVTDHGGRYEFDDVPPGVFRVTIPRTVYRADAAGYTVAASQLYYEPITRYGEAVEGETTTIDLVVRKAFDLVGKCVGPDGLPVAGASVKVWLGWKFYDYHRLDKPDRTAISDADGIFRFADLGDDDHRLVADKSGLSSVVVEKFRPSDYGPMFPLELIFEISTTVEGRVFDTDGHPIEGARVTASHYVEGGRVWQATVFSDTLGAYRLPVPPTSINRVTAAKTGYGQTHVEGILAGRRALDFVLAPTGQGGVAGRVMDIDGNMATHFEVNGIAFENAEGRFDLPLPPGERTLRIVSMRTIGVLQIPVTVTAGELLDIGLVALIPGRALDVVVLQPQPSGDLQPTGAATVRLLNTNQTLGPRNAGEIIYGFSAVPLDEPVRLTVTHPLFPPRTVELAPEAVPAPPDVLEIILALGEREALVQVIDTANTALAGAVVTWLVGTQPGRAFSTDFNGIAHLTGMNAATMTVKVEAEGFVSQTVQIPTALPAPETPLPATTVTLQPGGSVWGIVTARGLPLPATTGTLPTITLTTADATRTTQPVQVTQAGGQVTWRYEFRDVTPGDAWLSCNDFELYSRHPIVLDTESALQADLDFPGRATLRVRALFSNGQPAPNLTAYLYTLDSWTPYRSAASGPDGWFEFPFVTPGGWALSVITHGSSDQRLFPLTVPDGVETVTHTIMFPGNATGHIDGRVLLANPAVPVTESAVVLSTASATQFTLAIRRDDDATVQLLHVTAAAPMTDPAAISTAINQSQDAASIGIVATVDANRVVLAAANPAALPFFAVTPHDANATAVFGSAPFVSSHKAGNCRVSLEHLDVPLQTLLAGYISVDAHGYYRLAALVPGLYRPRVVPHYTGAPFAYAFGRDVTVPSVGAVSEEMPFVTIWATPAHANATGTLTLTGAGRHLARHVIVYVDNLDDPPTVYDTTLTAQRGITRRSGYHFGSFSGTTGSYTIPRLQRGHRYRATIHVTGFAPVTVDFDVPAAGPTAVTIPAVGLTWEPRFITGQ